MSTLSRLNNVSSPRFSTGLEGPSKAGAPTPRTSVESPAANALQDLFSADSFGPGAEGAQGLVQQLDQLVQTVSKLAELLGGQGAAPSPSQGTPGGGSTPGVGDPSSPGGDSSSPLGAQAEQVPELGDAASDVAGAGSGPGGKSDAQAFLGKGPHPQDQVYQEIAHDSPGLGEKNKGLWDAAHKAGATDEEAAVMVAQQMQEGGNDPTKSGGAENFGPLNLNRGLLKHFGGVAEGDLSKLNENSGGKYTPEALEANAKASLTAMRNMGTERYLDHVRGGSSGYDHPTERLPFAGPKTADDDTRRFGRNIANAANHVLEDFRKDPTSISRDWRQAADIPYV